MIHHIVAVVGLTLGGSGHSIEMRDRCSGDIKSSKRNIFLFAKIITHRCTLESTHCKIIHLIFQVL